MTRTRYGTSIWLDRVSSSKRPAFPKLKDELETEVVVVGGGLTGCLVACQFARAGVKTVLLEADTVAATAALDGGWIVETPGVGFRELQQLHGLRSARRAYELSRRSALDVAAFLRRLSIKCDLETRDALLVATSREPAADLEREHQARAAAGLDAAWLPPRRAVAESHIDQARGAIKTHSEGAFDPYRACIGIAGAAVKAGARVFERSPVRRLRPTSQRVEVSTEAATVRATSVVIATGAPRPLVAALQRHVRVQHSYCVATPELPRALQTRVAAQSIIRDTAESPHTIGPIARNRLLVQGGDQPAVGPRLEEKALVQRTGQLMYELSLLYPSISGVMPEYAWTATRVTGRDGLMLVGPHRNFPRHLFAVGVGSTGLAGAWLASRILLRRYTGQVEPSDEVFGFGR
jgi:glycine/D-amino acid oxidase-like deaminating enzyme